MTDRTGSRSVSRAAGRAGGSRPAAGRAGALPVRFAVVGAFAGFLAGAVIGFATSPGSLGRPVVITIAGLLAGALAGILAGRRGSAAHPGPDRARIAHEAGMPDSLVERLRVERLAAPAAPPRDDTEPAVAAKVGSVPAHARAGWSAMHGSEAALSSHGASMPGHDDAPRPPAEPTAPGWYEDRPGSGSLRLWDGERWTEHRWTPRREPGAGRDEPGAHRRRPGRQPRRTRGRRDVRA